ncbi:MAG TPA: hypothetical protein VMF05_06010 [Stellaceae bacterium]|nr:hypothetical protein [Stellaceae bacterium]
MTLAIRFLPNPGRSALSANGRSYAVGGAATVDVPYVDAIAIGPDQATRMTVIGATPDRPGNIAGVQNWPPVAMYDTTVGAPIFLVPGSNPASWVDIGGTAV